jgi:large subunit ribosomal protein L18
MSCICKKKRELRERRQKSVRLRVRGTEERPRLCVFRSNNHMYCQIIDDSQGTTLVALSTLHSNVKTLVAGKKPVEQAKLLGQELAKVCLEKDIKKVAFDRNGFIYHGRIEAVAAGAREGGLEF